MQTIRHFYRSVLASNERSDRQLPLLYLGPDLEYYRYQPLARDPQNPIIRILELFPGKPTDRIRSNLRRVAISDHPEYEAISYCWGASLQRRWIFCNDSLLEATENLCAALHRLRWENKSRYIWADAVCINQSDPLEKSHQVGLMKQIYQSAKVVNIWLGAQAEGSEDLKDFIPSLLEAKKKKIAENDERSIWELTSADRKRYGLPYLADMRYLSLLLITCRPWFGRVWIIQELSFATNAVVYCGDWSMPWESLLEASMWIGDIGVNTFFYVNDNHHKGLLQWTRKKVASGVNQKLITLLLRHRHAEATDPKDKIYALCGLACDSDSIELDYQTLPETVYRHTAIKLLTQDQNLDILSVANLHDCDNLKDLPSWVLGWNSRGLIKPLMMEHGDWEYEIPWQASGSTKCNPMFQNDGKTLGITGLLIDEIVDCGPPEPVYSPEPHQTYEISRILKVWYNEAEYVAIFYAWEKVAKARSGESYITGEPILDAFWQTICAGLLPEEGFEAGKRAFNWFDDWGTLNRWLTTFYPDTLGLDYHNWPFKVLRFMSSFTNILYRRNTTQAIIFDDMTAPSLGRRLVRTSKGYIGLGSQLVCVGDRVGLFKGSKVPLIVRRKGDCWQLVGESYVHGMMDGECFDEHACELMWFC